MIEQKIEPMLCERIFDEDLDSLEDFIIEPKYDGSRNLFFIDFEKNYLRIQHRSLANFTEKYPEFNLDVLKKIFNKNVKSVILDGELIARDFEIVLSRNNLTDVKRIEICSKLNPLKFVAFDILMLNGQDLRFLPLSERKHSLKKAIRKNPLIEVIAYWTNKEVQFSEIYRQLTLTFEGVVCKKLSSKYVSERTSSWFKCKPLQIDEFKVIGYNEKSGRSSYGSLQTDRGDVGLLSWDNLKEFDRLLSEVGIDKIWVEVEYQSINKSGKARFPIFRKWVVKRDNEGSFQQSDDETEVLSPLLAEK